MTDAEREALLAAVAKALPPGAGLPLVVWCDDYSGDLLKCATVDGYTLRVGNEHEVLFQVTGHTGAECVARMYAAVGVTR